VEEDTEVIQTDACQQPTNIEPCLGIQKRGEKEQTTIDSTESSKKKRKTMLRRTKNGDEDGDGEETECIHLQSRGQQVLVLPNTERFELQKKYQLVKRLRTRGMPATYTMLESAITHWKTAHVSSLFGVRTARRR
jgi:hypothetical protein